MAMAGGWTERTIRPKARSAPRSLGAALREAGLPDAAPDPHPDLQDDLDDAPTAIASHSHGASSARDTSIITESRSPRLAVFAEPEAALPVVTPLHHENGVVSPPPWLRAARRGRWRARMLNAFGWAMTLVVAGSIIGVAGRYLALPPPALETVLQARQ